MAIRPDRYYDLYSDWIDPLDVDIEEKERLGNLLLIAPRDFIEALRLTAAEEREFWAQWREAYMEGVA